MIQVDENISLEFLEEIHAEALLKLVNDNRTYLREWLPWVDGMQTVVNFRQYISNSKKQAADGTDFGYAIMVDRNIVGRIGLHHINQQNKIGEIGYWLADGMQGRGIITGCCKALIKYGFTELGLNRIEIKCGVGNDKSRAIAEKLQFKHEGILREAELLNGKFIDLHLYSMLAAQWNKTAK
ncbi:MAG: GNAT family N-acetyltransferase [Chitinophagaceae bacterium]|nr:GNAT family N-acetyltransferase [Chitinophagaceae bacterium]